MRKVILLSAICCLGLNIMVQASEVNLEDIAPSEKKVEAAITSEELKSEAIDRSIFDVGSTDVVTISPDGLYSVSTGTVDMQLYPSFGWICFTQDFAAQYDTYSSVFTDPLAVAESLVENGDHFTLLDTAFTTQISITVYEDAVSRLVKDFANMSDSDQGIVLETLKPSFPGYTGEVVNFGNRGYYKFVSPSGDNILYETYVNGQCIDWLVMSLDGSVLSEFIISDTEWMMTDFAVN